MQHPGVRDVPPGHAEPRGRLLGAGFDDALDVDQPLVDRRARHDAVAPLAVVLEWNLLTAGSRPATH